MFKTKPLQFHLLRIAAALRAAFTLALLTVATVLHGATFTVSNTKSSGPGSLRQAMLDAQYSADAKIVFDLAGNPPFTIDVDTPLPVMMRSVSIDGISQPGFVGTPLIAIVNRTSSPTIELRGGNSHVQGLRFVLTSGDGVVSRADNDQIFRNVFERLGDPSPDEHAAIRLSGSGAHVGVNTAGFGTCVVVEGGRNNWISENTFDGCYAFDVALPGGEHTSINSHNVLRGPIVNGNPAITIDAPAFDTYIGESVIEHAFAGIDVRGNGNYIQDNFIHDMAGYAIRVDGGRSNRITRNTLWNTGVEIVSINDGNQSILPPDLSQVTVTPFGTTIRGSLRFPEGGWRSFEVFQSDTCDASSPRLLVGIGSNNATNSFSFTIAPVTPGAYITVTATDTGADTSALSQCVKVQGSLSMPAPVITSISPTHGTRPQVVIRGANFAENTKAYFGGVPASSDYYRSDEIGVRPLAGAGDVDLVVRNPDGQEAKTTFHFDDDRCSSVWVNRAPQTAVAHGDDAATFTVVASSSSAPISYQWYSGAVLDRTHPIDGATSASFATTPSRGMTYWVEMTSPCGEANYAPARFVAVPRRAAPH